MREILFRGKRISSGEWVIGGIMPSFHPNFEHKSTQDFWFGTNNCYVICANNTDCFVEQETIGQYTGLKDKNGTKIFEGDILHYEGVSRDFLGIVVSEEWNCSCCNGVFGFSVDGIKGYSTPDLRDYDTSEVVGNIFDDDIKLGIKNEIIDWKIKRKEEQENG